MLEARLIVEKQFRGDKQEKKRQNLTSDKVRWFFRGLVKFLSICPSSRATNQTHMLLFCSQKTKLVVEKHFYHIRTSL